MLAGRPRSDAAAAPAQRFSKPQTIGPWNHLTHLLGLAWPGSGSTLSGIEALVQALLISAVPASEGYCLPILNFMIRLSFVILSPDLHSCRVAMPL